MFSPQHAPNAAVGSSKFNQNETELGTIPEYHELSKSKRGTKVFLRSQTENLKEPAELKRKTEAELKEIRQNMIRSGANNKKTIDLDKRHGVIDL